MLNYSCGFQLFKPLFRATFLIFNLILNLFMISFQIIQSSFASFQNLFSPLNIMVECWAEIYTIFRSVNILLNTFVERTNAISSKELDLLRIGKIFRALFFDNRIRDFTHLAVIIL